VRSLDVLLNGVIKAGTGEHFSLPRSGSYAIAQGRVGTRVGGFVQPLEAWFEGEKPWLQLVSAAAAGGFTRLSILRIQCRQWII